MPPYRTSDEAARSSGLTIDDLIVAREQWQMPAAELTFAAQRHDLDRYVECQRWARDGGLPQFVFAKLSTERKPNFFSERRMITNALRLWK